MYDITLTWEPPFLLRGLVHWTVSLPSSQTKEERWTFHARGIHIDTVIVDDIPCTFRQSDFLRSSFPTGTPPSPLRRVTALLVEDGIYACEKGEVAVTLPPSSSLGGGSGEKKVCITYHIPDIRMHPTLFVSFSERGGEGGTIRYIYPKINERVHTEGFGARCLYPCIDRYDARVENVHMKLVVPPEYEAIVPTPSSSCLHPSMLGWYIHRREEGKTSNIIPVDGLGEEGVIIYDGLCFIPSSQTTERGKEVDEAIFFSDVAQVWPRLSHRTATVRDAWIMMGLAMYLVFHQWMKTDTVKMTSLLSTWKLREGGYGFAISPGNVHEDPVAARLWAMQGMSWKTHGPRALAMIRLLAFYCLDPKQQEDVELVMRTIHPVIEGYIQRVFSFGEGEGGETEFSFMTYLRDTLVHPAPDIYPGCLDEWILPSPSEKGTPSLLGRVAYQEKQRRLLIVMKRDLPRNGHAPPPSRGRISFLVTEKGVKWIYSRYWSGRNENLEHKWSIACQTPKRKGKGGRLTRAEEQRAEQWTKVNQMEPHQLLALVSKRQSRRFWHPEECVQYVVMDPYHLWPGKLRWIQPHEYWLEILHSDDPLLVQDVYTQRIALDQLLVGMKQDTDPKRREMHLSIASYLASMVMDETRHLSLRLRAIQTLHELWRVTYRQKKKVVVEHVTATTTMESLFLAIYRALFPSSLSSSSSTTCGGGGGGGCHEIHLLLIDVISSIRSVDDHKVPEAIQNWMLDVFYLLDMPSATPPSPKEKKEREEIRAHLEMGAVSMIGNLSYEYMDDDEEDGITLRTKDVIEEIQLSLDLDIPSSSSLSGEGEGEGGRTTCLCLDACARMQERGLLPRGAIVYSFYINHPIWKPYPEVRIRAYCCLLASSAHPDKEGAMMLLRRERSMEVTIAVFRRWSEWNQGWEEHTLATGLWYFMHEGSAYSPVLRVIIYNIWKQIWGLEKIPPSSSRPAREEASVFETWMEEQHQLYVQRAEYMRGVARNTKRIHTGG